jgi:hypothetical protein
VPVARRFLGQCGDRPAHPSKPDALARVGCELGCGPVASVELLLSLFGEQLENFLPLGFIGDRFEQAHVVLNVLAPNESVHVRSNVNDLARRVRGRPATIGLSRCNVTRTAMNKPQATTPGSGDERITFLKTAVH